MHMSPAGNGRNVMSQGRDKTARTDGRYTLMKGGLKINTGMADNYDYNLLACVILLTCFGLVMLYSASAYRASVAYEGNDMFFFRKQALISAAAILAAIYWSTVDYHRYISLSALLYIFSTALMVITRYAGTEVNGATRWLRIGPVSFQPAEMAKLAVILFLAYVISHIGYGMKGIKAPLFVGVFGFCSAFVTYFFTNNLSTAVIIAAICAFMIFIVHPKTVPFLIMAGIGLALILLVVFVILPRVIPDVSELTSEQFRLIRILVWRKPEAYPDSGGYQVLQGLYAVGSGGLFGKGLGNGVQKLGSIPEAQNDMIFSIICEELGLFGALIVIFLYVFLLYRLFNIAKNAPDLTGSLIATGIFIHIALQVILNIAVVLNLIPTTGISLPFISYGGTSILFLMAEMAIALNISSQCRPEGAAS